MNSPLFPAFPTNAFDYIRGSVPFRVKVQEDLDEPHRDNPAVNRYVKFKGGYK
jgi:hypothetical protein